jgi:hypothetical protein
MLRWRWQRFCSHCGCLFHALWFACKWALILLILGVVWLCVWGLPRPWLDRGLAELAKHGLYLKVGQARLDIFNGVAFEDVALLEKPDATTPLLAAKKIRLFLNPAEWREGRHGIRSVNIINGSALLELGYPHMPHVGVSNIYARLILNDRDLRLTEWACNAFGVHWYGRGLVREAFTGASATPKKIDSVSLLAALRAAEPGWLKPVLDFRNAVQLADTPALEFTFDVHRAAASNNLFHADLRGGSAVYRGVQFAPWQLALNTTGALLHASLNLTQGTKRLAAQGRLEAAPPYDAFARVVCDLPPDQVVALLPAAWQQAYDKSRIRINGSASGEVAFGPGPASNLLARIEGQCRLRGVDAAGVTVNSLRMQFQRNADDWKLTRIAADVGTGRQRGQLEGSFTTSAKTLAFVAQAHTTFDPNACRPAIRTGVTNLLSFMKFTERPPEADIVATGVLTNAADLVVTGRVTASRFIFRDEPVTLASSAFHFTRGVLTLPDAVVVREDGQAHGHVKYHLDEQWIELNVTGNAPPHPVAHMIAPDFERVMRKFEFQGPVQLVIRGRVATGGGLKGTDLHVRAEGEKLGWQKILADRASFDLHARDAQFTFTNIHGVFCGGPFAGWVALSDVESPTNCRYTVTAALTNANAAQLSQMLRAQFATNAVASTNATLSGELTARVQMAGWVEPWKSLEGSGHVYIHNGSILQVRLFGGLSKILSKLYPGLGYLSQTEFLMPFTVEAGKLKSEEIDIKGTVISLKSHGEYQLGGDLNFQTQVKLLRSGIAADILRILTFPVTKLLEFKLIGTLDDPRWRPVNLPKELFLQFD